MSLWAAITNRLSTDATLTQQLGNTSQGVFYGRLPAHEQFPFVSVTSPGGTVMQLNAPMIPSRQKTGGAPYIEAVQAQIDVFTEDAGVANTLAKRIDFLLNFATDLVVDDAQLLKIARTNSIDVLQMEDESDEVVADVWRVTLLYEIWLQKSL